MPVVVTITDEADAWLAAAWPDARHLRQPMPDGVLRIVARGEREDPPAKTLLLA